MTNTSTNATYTATTRSNGLYSLNGVAAGTYTLAEVVQSGYVQTAPASPGIYTITVTAGQASATRTSATITRPSGVYREHHRRLGAGSFRQAIIDADSADGPSTITFDIGTGEQTIESSLPYQRSRRGHNRRHDAARIFPHAIDRAGWCRRGNRTGLTITGNGITVKGLIVSGFCGDGIELTGNDNLIESNYIGTDFTGTKPLGKGAAGIVIAGGATDNTIGGTTAGAGNVIAANSGDGVADTGTNSNLIAGNWIGTNAMARRHWPTPVTVWTSR